MPEKIHALMDDCADDDPDNRPSFEEIDLRLKRIDAETVITGESKNKNSQVSLFDIFPRHIAEALRDGKEVRMRCSVFQVSSCADVSWFVFSIRFY